MQERGWVRAGGWAAIAAGALSPVVAGLEIGRLQGAGVAGPLAAARAVTAVAWVVAVMGANAALRPATWVSRLGLGLGVVGAGLWLAASLGGATSTRLFAFAAPLVGAWMLCVVAAAWRSGALPAWLRIVGAVEGASLMMSPAIPPLGALVLLLGFGWWFGLGAALLRQAGRTPA